MDINLLLEELTLNKKLKSITFVESKRKVVTLTRRFKYDGRSNRHEFILTVGAPNYLARAKIKQRTGDVGYYLCKFYPKKKPVS